MRHKYSNEEHQFIIDKVKGITLKELTKRFNQKFNLNVNEKSIANIKRKLGLKSGIVGGRFEKGHIPANKGKKGLMSPEQYERCKATMFKKGNVPVNCRPIGSERVDARDGSILIKIQDGHKTRNWTSKSRYIYEQAHGPIPKGHKVIFADGNNRNFDLDNLVLVSNAEELIMNQKRLFREDAEFTKTGINVAKLLNKAKKR